MTETVPTPGAKWRENGEPDPHRDCYNCQRHELMLGSLTDDELANEVFLRGDTKPDMAAVLAGQARMPIVYLGAAKHRIRWLSRREAELTARVATLEKLLKPFADCGRALPEWYPADVGLLFPYSDDVLPIDVADLRRAATIGGI